MELFNNLLLKTNDFLTGYVLLIALVGGGIWFTIQTGFVQFREFGNGWKRVFGGLFKKDKGSHGAGGICILPGTDHCYCSPGRNW